MENFLLILAVLLLFLTGFFFTAGIDRIERRVRRGEKSEKKMQEIIANGKATILVSHSIPQIKRMCNKVLWLNHGKQIAFGEAGKICEQYELFLKTGQFPCLPQEKFETENDNNA